MLPGMIVDEQAEVLENRTLSADYNVVTLGAASIAAAASPGQFVMVKTRPGLDPLLRRPFSIFEIVRDVRRDATGDHPAQQARRRRHRPALRRPRRVTDSALPRSPRAAVRHSWTLRRGMDGGRRRRPRAVRHADRGPERTRRPAATVLRRAPRRRTCSTRTGSRSMGVDLVLATEDGSRGTPGRITVPLEAALREAPADTAITIYCLRADADDAGRRASGPPTPGATSGSRSNRSWAAAWAAATAAWCP